MDTLAGYRSQFTRALNQYHRADDPEARARFAERMAKYIAAARANGFTTKAVTRGQTYPGVEVHQHINGAETAREVPRRIGLIIAEAEETRSAAAIPAAASRWPLVAAPFAGLVYYLVLLLAFMDAIGRVITDTSDIEPCTGPSLGGIIGFVLYHTFAEAVSGGHSRHVHRGGHRA